MESQPQNPEFRISPVNFTHVIVNKCQQLGCCRLTVRKTERSVVNKNIQHDEGKASY